jgi:hypothetical protein
MTLEDLKDPIVRVRLYADGRVVVLRLQVLKASDGEYKYVKKECLSNRGEWVEVAEGNRYGFIENVIRESVSMDPAYPDELLGLGGL